MSELDFDVIGAEPDRFAAAPTLVFKLKVTERSGAPIHVLALRCQIRIEPQRRRYAPEEEERLLSLFGETPQWGDSLRPFLWTHAGAMVSGFTGETDVDLPVACSYDLDVAAAKYFHSLGDGEIPLILLFNGTVFASASDGGMSVDPVPWHKEFSYRLPVAVWRDMMDLYFPDSGWLRLQVGTLDALERFKASRALFTADQALEALLKEAEAGR